MMIKHWTALSVALLASASTMAASKAADNAQIMDLNISASQVVATQKAWCAALLQISNDYRNGGLAKAKATATSVIDTAYAFQYGPVAFKPTLTVGEQTFRSDREGAIAYFVGNNPKYPRDTGFALKPWKTCTIKNQVIQLNGATATTMGNVVLTDTSGKTTTVDKTWTFMREPDGQVRIVVHHSSLPFSG